MVKFLISHLHSFLLCSCGTIRKSTLGSYLMPPHLPFKTFTLIAHNIFLFCLLVRPLPPWAACMYVSIAIDKCHPQLFWCLSCERLARNCTGKLFNVVNKMKRLTNAIKFQRVSSLRGGGVIFFFPKMQINKIEHVQAKQGLFTA